MFSKLVITTVAMFTMTSAIALADQMGPNGDKFYEEAAHFENACMGGQCQGDYTKKTVYNQKLKLNNLGDGERDALKTVAEDQVQVWGDTILEGDYFASGRTRLDEVVAYYKKDTLVGYKIQYSQKAWYTGDCAFNGKRSSLEGCKEGRIMEGSYVSPDKQTYFSDEERYAEFTSTQN